MTYLLVTMFYILFALSAYGWNFAYIADHRAASGMLPGVNTTIVAKIAEDIATNQIELVLIGGDLIIGEYGNVEQVMEQYSNFLSAISAVTSAGIPIYPVPGNHEFKCQTNHPTLSQYEIATTAWANVFGFLPANGPNDDKLMTYSFEYKNALFLGLNEWNGYDTSAYKGVDTNWLALQLNASTQTHIFAFGHNPMTMVTGASNENNRNVFWNLLGKAGCRIYFCGHKHYRARTLTKTPDSRGNLIIELTDGAGGAPLVSSEQPPFPDPNDILETNIFYDHTHFGYTIVSVSNNAFTCRWRYLTSTNEDAEWATTDEFTINPDYTQTKDHMTSYITNQMTNEQVMGLAIGFIDGTNVVWMQGFGYADYEAQKPVVSNTVFHIGSVSKVFTTTAILKLMEEGKVDIDAPVTNYISDFSIKPRFQTSSPITVKMLLNHKSGLPGDFFYAPFSTQPLPPAYYWLIDYLKNDYPSFQPDQISVYCNSGFVLAEGIAPAVSGKSFVDYAQEAVFSPLNMNSSSYVKDLPNISNNLAYPYLQFKRMPEEYISVYGTGSMYSSIPDLLRFMMMLNQNGWLDGKQFMETNTIDIMTKDESTNNPLISINSIRLSGMGWDFVRYYELDYAGPVWIKSGGTMAYTAYIATLPTRQLAAAVICSTPSVGLMQTVVEILKYALWEKTGEHWPTNTLEPPYSPIISKSQEELNSLTGYYISRGKLHEIIANANSLTWRSDITGNEPSVISDMLPRSNGWFSSTSSPTVEITFTNVDNYTLLISRRVNGAYQLTSLVGYHYVPKAIPAEWQSRCQKLYLSDNMHPLDYTRQLLENYAMTFSQKSNVLYVVSPIHYGFLEASNANLALTLGLDNRGPSSVYVVQTNGVEKMICSGYTFIDTQNIPTLRAGFFNSISTSLQSTAENFWVKLITKNGLEYKFRAKSSSSIQAILCNASGDLIKTTTNANEEPIDFQADGNAFYYGAISGDGYNTPTFKICLNVINHGGHDVDGDGMADPAIITQDGFWLIHPSSHYYAPYKFKLFSDIGTPLLADADGDGMADPIFVSGENWYVYMSSYDYQLRGPFNLALGAGIPVAADFDGDGKADPATVDGTLWKVRLSSEGYTYRSFYFDIEGQPAPGDFDGDGKADPAVFNGSWTAWLSGSNYQKVGPVLHTDEIALPIP